MHAFIVFAMAMVALFVALMAGGAVIGFGGLLLQAVRPSARSAAVRVPEALPAPAPRVVHRREVEEDSSLMGLGTASIAA